MKAWRSTTQRLRPQSIYEEADTFMSVTNEYVKGLDREYVFHSWSTQGALNPLVIAGGKGCTVWDYEGKQYLDFSSQLINTNLGHQHPAVISAIKEQAGTLTTVAPATANHMRGEAAKRIIEQSPKGFRKVFFTNGGADANENAIRMARLFTGRDKVLSAYRSYHGNTGSAIVATGDARRVPNEYARGHVHFFTPYLYRTEFNAQTEAEETERALRHLRRIIESEGAGSIAAILLESLPGTAGVLLPPAAYMKGVRELANEFGILLILDEVMSGFGRTGKWFALEHYEIIPDLITFAKGVNSGYVPVGGVIISEQLCAYFDTRFFPGGLTYSGHPLAMASVVASIDALRSEGVVKNALEIGATQLGPRLRELQERHASIGEVRGVGVFWALEFVTHRETRAPVPADKMQALKAKLMERGLLPFVVENRIHVAPPCIVTAEEVEAGVAILDEVIGSVLE
ncbi:aspartate aminotransferase family protein [Pseudomonas atacamensis]|uniref:aspartate aminotransferase family protein n=1 Tax=Pseudomonas atacamensis TaxID=2565368 RepID=UPI00244BA8A9|nr:aspartate aminotransferase family protein [Pseudomonas atacamensis]MDH2076855.1 aspartate aminotransferase family protein [Pseudomonas atacamensis]